MLSNFPEDNYRIAIVLEKGKWVGIIEVLDAFPGTPEYPYRFKGVPHEDLEKAARSAEWVAASAMDGLPVECYHPHSYDPRMATLVTKWSRNLREANAR